MVARASIARYHLYRMDAGTSPLPIHSLAEAYLYLMVTPCSDCGSGPLKAAEERVHHDTGRRILTVPVVCGKCEKGRDIWFDTTGAELEQSFPEALCGLDLPQLTPIINATDEPSRIIDIAQWLTLFTVIADEAGKTKDSIGARQLKLEAAQCLDEAVKFYDEDNDLPPEEAFYHDRTRRQFRDRPETFARGRLVSLRAKMPQVQGGGLDPNRTEDEDAAELKAKHRWWQRRK